MAVKREQGVNLEDQKNTRQDRNFSLTDGGTLTWSPGTNTLSWSGTLEFRIPGFSPQLIAPGSIATISAANTALYVTLNRTSGAISGFLTAGLNSPIFSSQADNVLVLAVRGTDNKLYFRNGTIFSPTDTKTFGSLNSATDRNEITADGLALQTVGFSYTMGTSQLAVFVGGFLQIEGIHYVETSTTQITFQAGYIPVLGELISFLNIVGGEGPPGTPDLDDAYTNGATIDVIPGTPVQGNSTGGSGTTPVWQVGHASSQGGLAAFQILRSGDVRLNKSSWRDAAGDFFQTDMDGSGNFVLRSSVAPYYGVQWEKTSGGMAFGVFPPGGPFTANGFLRWKVFTGTTHATLITTIPHGLGADVKAAQLSVDVAVGHKHLGGYGAFDSSYQYALVDDGTNIVICLDHTATGSPPATNIRGKSYTLIVWY